MVGVWHDGTREREVTVTSSSGSSEMTRLGGAVRTVNVDALTALGVPWSRRDQREPGRRD